MNPSTPSGGHSQNSKPGTKPYLSPSFQMLALLDPHVIHLPPLFLKANFTSGLFAEVTQKNGCSKGSVGCFLFHFVFRQSKAKIAKNRTHPSGSEHPSIKKPLRGRGQYPQPQEVTLVGAGLTGFSGCSGSSGVATRWQCRPRCPAAPGPAAWLQD